MSTEPIWRIESTSAANTFSLAAKVGSKLKGGEVIELVSDLGGGKTTFVKGLAKGMGSQDNVHSPSFTLKNEYQGSGLKLYHFDFYRLNEPGIMQQEITEAVADQKAVVVVEWPEIIKDVLPPARLTIKLQTSSNTARTLEFRYPPGMAYLLPVSG